jgi:hypothetical protein
MYIKIYLFIYFYFSTRRGVMMDPWVVETCKVLSELFSMDIQPGKFPGCLPVDVDRTIVSKLALGYVCSLKADGERAFLFLQGNHAWFYHRTGQIQWIHQPLDEEEENGPITLFDVEVIQDDIYLFDTLMYKSRNLLRADYLQRVELARKWCKENGAPKPSISSKTHHRIPSRFPDCTVFLGTYKVQAKAVFPTHALQHMASEAGPMAQDGLIFTQLRSAYLPYRTSLVQVLKWKPPSHLTIDVHITTWEPRPMKFPQDLPDPFRFDSSSTRRHPNYVFWVMNDSKTLVPLTTFSGKLPSPLLPGGQSNIYETSWNNHDWEVIKRRGDKRVPNALFTVLATLRLVLDPIQHTTLVEALA